MKKYAKVLFVCNGNTCRSPMAATVLNYLKGDRELAVGSRGMVVLFPEPYNPKAIGVAAARGMIMPNNSAKEISEEDFGKDVLVLTMSEKQKNRLYSQFKKAINVYTMMEYAGVERDEVKDPYGGDMQAYARCFDEIQELVEKVAEVLFKEDNEDDSSDWL